MAWIELEIVLQVRSYIAHPYWPEVEQVVDIQKKSGLNRARSEDKRSQVLKAYLEKAGMTMEDYAALVTRSQRAWYRESEPDGPIVIPRHHLSGALVQGCLSAPAGARIRKEALRSIVQLGDLVTPRTKADTIFRRFVRPSDGTGKPLSNQRALRENEVIENFPARGALSIDVSAVEPDSVQALLAYVGKFIGVGASRKMGYGRFDVTAFGGDEITTKTSTTTATSTATATAT